ncbi:type VII secretion protein EccCa [Dactylosporangium vinaceum]|uniref:Type VII secretion protein EccCa n=1 Tax=Dactylosporangium vinaceum TaxID=53362 RepID=A0ABV5ML49_9ACTN|nr:type VII secretion protein EccCa [Dactylosporangium vinaceum]UAB94042.1 type VII secretion protein EccCa [Dactylosporangium vinaceum]
MPTTAFRRPSRVPRPSVPEGEVLLQPPPELTKADTGNVWLTALPALSGLGSVAYLFAAPGNPITYVAGSFFLFSSLAMVAGSLLRARATQRADAENNRRDYLRYLDRMRERVRRTVDAQREAAAWVAPPPEQLWAAAAGARLWERRVTDPDYGWLRLGVGTQYLATRLVPGESGPVEDLDPLCALALRRFIASHSAVPELPVQLSLRRYAAIALSGDRDEARALARALVAQAVTWHAPGDLRVAVCTGDPEASGWAWVKWLPHAQHRTEVDHAGPVRLVSPSMTALEEWLEDELANRAGFNRHAAVDPDLPHLLIVLDGGLTTGQELLLNPDGLQAATVIDLDGRTAELVRGHGVELVVADGRLDTRVGTTLTALGRPDGLHPAVAAALAEQIAEFRLDVATAQAEDLATVDQTLPGLLGVDDPGHLDLTALWAPRPLRDRLRAPLGIAADGGVLELDIKESAYDGMGPHGLVIGATGSGKSELLRTLVLALASTHPPDQLNLVLVDFKGGATFAGMSGLPHVAAVITNLQDDLTMVDRMQEALSGEMNRRQEILRAAGNLVSIRDYDRARQRGADLPPLPSLFIVVDEFSELLSQKPDFADLFAQIGRLGRSLGLHLLLASQRLDEGRLRGLEANLSYRICLRTFTEQESRTVLGVPDAYSLPSAPGHGYMRGESANLRRFRAAYVSGPYGTQEQVGDQLLGGGLEVRAFRAEYQAAPPAPAELGAGWPAPDQDDSAQTVNLAEVESGGPTVLSTMVGQLTGQGTPAHRVWLPPLNTPDTLDMLLPQLRVRPGRGFGADPLAAPLKVPVAIVDRPFHQRRDPLWVDLAGAGGHAGIVGGPRSGKSTLLRTLICALALRHTPAEVQFYALDFSGTLFGLAGLPHVGGVAGRQDAETVRRIVAEVTSVIEDRERRFRELGVDTMADYRRLREDGGGGDDRFGDVFLVVDNWSVLRQDYEDLETALVSLAARSLTYGVHLVMTANRWLDLRFGLRDLIGTKLELKLGDALDSEIDRKAQLAVPGDRPGRGVSADRMQFLAAVPRIDRRRQVDDLSAGISGLVQAVTDYWDGPAAPRVRLLPALVEFADLPKESRERGIVLGLEGRRLRPVEFEWREPGLVLLGDAESGKTSTLRVVGRQVVDTWPAKQAKVVLIDYRRGMLGEFDGESLLGYAANQAQAEDVVAGLVTGFTRRLPGADVTPQQLRNRSWWTGPDVYLLIDDYELVTSGVNPLLPLLPFLSQARDIGFYPYVARRAGGASRALMDPFLGAMRELSFPAVVMSAPRDEAPMFGVRPASLPPGRGTLVHRKFGTVPVQMARLDARPETV